MLQRPPPAPPNLADTAISLSLAFRVIRPFSLVELVETSITQRDCSSETVGAAGQARAWLPTCEFVDPLNKPC
jgi:hypothetical protein